MQASIQSLQLLAMTTTFTSFTSQAILRILISKELIFTPSQLQWLLMIILIH